MTTYLQNDVVQLRQMVKEDADALWAIAQDDSTWTYLPITPRSLEAIEVYINEALANQAEFPMVIIDMTTNKIVGATKFMAIDAKNKTAEIGFSWLSPSARGTAINSNAKYLLMSYAFEQWGLRRVTIKTDAENIASCKAIEAIGATKEGVLRNHRIRKDGKNRDTVIYSVIEEEWPQVKVKLGERCAAKNV
ncbi:MAG TPA: GNAT family N-acetyltransferase [Metalysinibacillus jejuensis]|uniref:GNAT family N-acetyltransferase n=1 Tax=Metalysinibacillus jejuensis TaxID=914327 RepID=A0A921NDN9_9BACL|nr:GNAT family protein [Metalysinibacillus jejuensis]HJH11714.1 GNAT family N-acetyltransferase [Metalysinibacillus jejuensis]